MPSYTCIPPPYSRRQMTLSYHECVYILLKESWHARTEREVRDNKSYILFSDDTVCYKN